MKAERIKELREQSNAVSRGYREAMIECLDAIEQLQADRQQLLELVAVTCRDGGHYHAEHGTVAAVKEGSKNFYALIEDNDRLRAVLTKVHHIALHGKSIASDIQALVNLAAEALKSP